jgi:hypothetical protein
VPIEKSDLEKYFTISVLAIIIIVFALLFYFYMGTFSSQGDLGNQLLSINPPNLSYNLSDCKAGDSGSFQVSQTTKMDLKVVGLISHKGKDACHSSGTITQEKSSYEIDIYRVGPNDECIALLSLSNPDEYGEKCYGYWPGYNPT